MTALDLGRGLVFNLVAAAILAGCSISLPYSETSVTVSSATIEAAGLRAPISRSKAAGDDLLYVATGDNVYVLSYPVGKVIGALNVAGHNICSDNNGNVFVPQTATDQILVYAHGSSSPIEILNDVDQPLGCATDPTTGNLAVTNEGSGPGEVAIYPNAQGPPTYYSDPEISTYGLCGYDSFGNLFLDGTGRHDELAELPKGSGVFKNFALDNRFVAFGSVQWDGKYITLTNPSLHVIHRIDLTLSRLRIASTTRIRGWRNSYSGHWPYTQTWLQNGTFIGQARAPAEIGLWLYPDGGQPRKVIDVKSGGAVVYGVTVSLAASNFRLVH